MPFFGFLPIPALPPAVSWDVDRKVGLFHEISRLVTALNRQIEEVLYIADNEDDEIWEKVSWEIEEAIVRLESAGILLADVKQILPPLYQIALREDVEIAPTKSGCHMAFILVPTQKETGGQS